MSLEQASLLAQIVSAVAVIASLIFVGVQLRQTSRTVRASSSQAHSHMYHAIIASLIDDGEFARIWRRALIDPESIGDDEMVRFLAFASTLFRFYESSRVQWLKRLLDDEHWHTIERQACDLSTQPGIHHWWALRRSWHSADFRSWFEHLPPEPIVAIYGQPAGEGGQAPGAAAASDG